MLHDYSNENVGETNSEKNEEENCEFLNQETLPYKNVHRWNPHDLKRSKIYSLMEKYPILYDIWRGKVVPRSLAFCGCLDKLGGKILLRRYER